jgi:hypothetical protein
MYFSHALIGRAKTVPHKPKPPQKAVFTLDDFDELDETARFEALIRASAPGHPNVSTADSEEFILEFGIHEGSVSSTAGRVVRGMAEAAITLETRESFDATIKDLHTRVHEDKKGFISWRSPSARSFRVLRPSLVRDVERDWIIQSGAIGRWSTRVHADGTRTEAILFHPIDKGVCPEETWERLVRAARRLCDETAKGCGLLAVVHGPRVH